MLFRVLVRIARPLQIFVMLHRSIGALQRYLALAGDLLGIERPRQEGDEEEGGARVCLIGQAHGDWAEKRLYDSMGTWLVSVIPYRVLFHLHQ